MSFLILFTIVAWGSSAVFTKLALNYLSPFTVFFIACLSNIPFILIYYLFFFKDFKFNTLGFIYSFIGSIITILGSLAYFLVATERNISSVTSLVSIYPALTCILSIFFLQENFSINKFFGIFLIILGAFIIGK